MVTRWQMELITKVWRKVGAGGHMALMDMRPRNNKLCHDYIVRVVANMFHVSSNLLSPLVQMLDWQFLVGES
jgi:hypothetical protein